LPEGKFNNQNQSPEQKTPAIELQQEALRYLNETRKWTYFLAIMGFVFIGIMVIIGLFMGVIFSKFAPGAVGKTPFPTGITGFIYIVLGVIYLFPTLYLLKFSTWTKKAVSSMSSGGITQAVKNLKSLFRFIGILMIVMMGLYVVFIIVFAAGGMMKAFV